MGSKLCGGRGRRIIRFESSVSDFWIVYDGQNVWVMLCMAFGECWKFLITLLMNDTVRFEDQIVRYP